MRSILSMAASISIRKWRTSATDALKPWPPKKNKYCIGCGSRSIVTLGSPSCSRRPPETNWLVPSSKISSPWLMISTSGEKDKKLLSMKFPYNFYSLAEKRVMSIIPNHHSSNNNNEAASYRSTDPRDAVCIGSAYGWLAFIRRSDCSVFLCNPISGRQIKLPSITTLPISPEQHDNTSTINEIALSSPRPDVDEDCRVMIIYYRNETDQGELAFCSPAHGDTKWTTSSLPALDWYQNIVYSSKHQLFFAMTFDFEVESWDLRDPLCPKGVQLTDIMVDEERHPGRIGYEIPATQPEIEQADVKFLCIDNSYLVPDELSGHLFWVDRFIQIPGDEDGSHLPYKTWTFDVYKFDITDKVMRYLDEEAEDSLENRAIFIGRNQSLLLSTIDFPELNPNSIYFTDDHSLDPTTSRCAGQDLGIYNYKDKTFRTFLPCYHPRDNRSMASCWFTPNFH